MDFPRFSFLLHILTRLYFSTLLVTVIVLVVVIEIVLLEIITVMEVPVVQRGLENQPNLPLSLVGKHPRSVVTMMNGIEIRREIVNVTAIEIVTGIVIANGIGSIALDINIDNEFNNRNLS